MKLAEVLLSTLMASFLHTPVYTQKYNCPELKLDNGRVKFRSRGKVAMFQCRRGHTLLGDKTALCMKTGAWSRKPPICISRGCPALGAIPNSEITETYNGAMLKFTCSVGTRRRGPETITCDGKAWSDPAPTCEKGLALSCDFEDDLCGWSQDDSDNFDWTRISERTQTNGTGPLGDHTTQSGFYMYTESSIPQKSGDIARLNSPIYPNSLNDACFAFWYHMQGPSKPGGVGSLQVFIKPESTSLTDIDPAFYVEGNQGPKWRRGLIHISAQPDNFKIVIMATRKRSHVSDIAIDDLRIFNCSQELASTKIATSMTTTVSTTTTSTAATTTSATTSTRATTTTTTITPAIKTDVPNARDPAEDTNTEEISGSETTTKVINVVGVKRQISDAATASKTPLSLLGYILCTVVFVLIW